MTFFLFVCFCVISKESFSPPWKETSCILLLNARAEVKMSDCSEASSIVTVQCGTHLTKKKKKAEYLLWKLPIFCLSNPPIPNQPTFLTGNCSFTSFTVSLATLAERERERDRDGFTRRKSATVESLFTAWLRCWYSLACVTLSLLPSMSISASHIGKYIISVSMVMPVVTLLVKSDSVKPSFFLSCW